MKITDFVQQVKQGSIDVVEHTHKSIEEIKKINEEYNYFNVICEEEAIKQAASLQKKAKGLSNEYKRKSNYQRKKELQEKDSSGEQEELRFLGVPISIKDCICVKNIESTAGSKILKGYKPVFDAAVVEKLRKEGAIIIGKTAQDEFGFGSFNINVGAGFNVPLNPFDKKRCTGGSSGGSAGITQKARFHVSIAESTGGSIAAPASFCGTAGFTPTYGLVSRYGLIDYANSMDKIGAMAKTTDDCALLIEIISGHDSRDSTSLNAPEEEYYSLLKKDVRKYKIGVIKEFLHADDIDKDIKKSVWKTVEKLEEFKIQHHEVSLPITAKYAVPVYYLIAMAEASTNLAKYCGLRYGVHEKLEGNFNDYFTKVRSNSFGKEAKRRIILGTFARMAGYRDAYYIKALKARSEIIKEYKKSFKDFDCLLSPTMPVAAPKFSEIESLSPAQNYLMDVMTVGPNLAGLPHISVTGGYSKSMPVGVMFTGNHLQDRKVLQLGNLIQ